MNLTAAAHHFFGDTCQLTDLGSSSGCSGSTFARIITTHHAWCLRRWPEGFAPERLAAIHRILRLSSTHGFDGVPTLATTRTGSTVLELDGSLYDAQAWVCGVPLDSISNLRHPIPNAVQNISGPARAALGTAIARFHVSTVGLSPSIGDRHVPLAEQRDVAITLLRSLNCVDDELRGNDQRIVRTWQSLLPVALTCAATALAASSETAQEETVICHDDLWPRHVYVQGDQVCGFIDFESVAFSSPATDLAHAILHFGGWETAGTVLRAYQDVRPLPYAVRALVPVAALLDLAGEGMWSLKQISRVPAGNAEGHIHRHNLRVLLPSLTALVDEFR